MVEQIKKCCRSRGKRWSPLFTSGRTTTPFRKYAEKESSRFAVAPCMREDRSTSRRECASLEQAKISSRVGADEKQRRECVRMHPIFTPELPTGLTNICMRVTSFLAGPVPGVDANPVVVGLQKAGILQPFAAPLPRTEGRPRLVSIRARLSLVKGGRCASRGTQRS